MPSKKEEEQSKKDSKEEEKIPDKPKATEHDVESGRSNPSSKVTKSVTQSSLGRYFKNMIITKPKPTPFRRSQIGPDFRAPTIPLGFMTQDTNQSQGIQMSSQQDDVIQPRVLRPIVPLTNVDLDAYLNTEHLTSQSQHIQRPNKRMYEDLGSHAQGNQQPQKQQRKRSDEQQVSQSKHMSKSSSDNHINVADLPTNIFSQVIPEQSEYDPSQADQLMPNSTPTQRYYRRNVLKLKLVSFDLKTIPIGLKGKFAVKRLFQISGLNPPDSIDYTELILMLISDGVEIMPLSDNQWIGTKMRDPKTIAAPRTRVAEMLVAATSKDTRKPSHALREVNPQKKTQQILEIVLQVQLIRKLAPTVQIELRHKQRLLAVNTLVQMLVTLNPDKDDIIQVLQTPLEFLLVSLFIDADKNIYPDDTLRIIEKEVAQYNKIKDDYKRTLNSLFENAVFIAQLKLAIVNHAELGHQVNLIAGNI